MWLSGYKTYVLAASTLLGVAYTYLNGQVTAEQAVQLAVTALFAAAIRHGVANS